jgi:hypothetical protein
MKGPVGVAMGAAGLTGPTFLIIVCVQSFSRLAAGEKRFFVDDPVNRQRITHSCTAAS